MQHKDFGQDICLAFGLLLFFFMPIVVLLSFELFRSFLPTQILLRKSKDKLCMHQKMKFH